MTVRNRGKRYLIEKSSKISIHPALNRRLTKICAFMVLAQGAAGGEVICRHKISAADCK